MTWLDHVRADPLPWLLSEDNPAVRAATLQRLLGEAPNALEVRQARAAAMNTDPIRSILAAQEPGGWWEKPGPGYGPKYFGTDSTTSGSQRQWSGPLAPSPATACLATTHHSGRKSCGAGTPDLLGWCLSGTRIDVRGKEA